MVFIFRFVNMVYHIDWFAYIEESLHPWNKPSLIMVWTFWCVAEFCLLKLCWGFCIYVHQWYWPVVSFFVLSLALVSGWWWPHRMSLEVFLLLKIFLKSFRSIGIQFSSVAQSCLTLCDPTNCSTPCLPVHHQLLESTQTHVHRVGDAI